MVRIFQPSSEIYVMGGPIFRNIRTHGRQTISKGSIYFKLAVKYMFWGVQIFQVSCEIYVLRGPNILKYKDWEEPFFWGGPIFL